MYSEVKGKPDIYDLKDWRDFVDVEDGHDVGRDVNDDLVRAVDGGRGDVRLKVTN